MVFVKKPPFRDTRKRGFLSWIGFFLNKLYLSQAIHPISCDQILLRTWDHQIFQLGLFIRPVGKQFLNIPDVRIVRIIEVIAADH